MYAYALFETPIGRCGLAWSEDGVIGVQLPEKNVTTTRLRLLRHCPAADEMEPPRHIARAIADIRALLQGEKKSLRAVQLDTSYIAPFHARVYDTTRSIPPGQTRTYGEIARAVGRPEGARAVGQALSRNPFAIIVPCHRVIGVNEKLTGFSANGGIATKLKMLQIEGWRAQERELFEELT